MEAEKSHFQHAVQMQVYDRSLLQQEQPFDGEILLITDDKCMGLSHSEQSKNTRKRKNVGKSTVYSDSETAEDHLRKKVKVVHHSANVNVRAARDWQTQFTPQNM